MPLFAFARLFPASSRKRPSATACQAFLIEQISWPPLLSAGALDDGGRRLRSFAESGGENYRKLLFEQDRLARMIFLGKTERADVYANLIRSRTPLGTRRESVLRQAMDELRQV